VSNPTAVGAVENVMSMFSFPDTVKTLLLSGTAKSGAAGPLGVATYRFGAAVIGSSGVNVIPPRVIGAGGMRIPVSVGVNGLNVTAMLVELFASKVTLSS
jgi:hypothetical protein